ncbi:DNA translocase FtsK [Comamonas sp.]|uniref:DNA translocase FtsK n=1 Tax=Comamonas sp. TaxID=34028 RepID=UPI003A90D5A7
MSTPDNQLIDAARGREDQYMEAVALAMQKASVSFLQRKLVTSYHHAEDLLERMISDGHITDYSGRCIEKVQARQIIQLRAYRRTGIPAAPHSGIERLPAARVHVAWLLRSLHERQQMSKRDIRRARRERDQEKCNPEPL